LTLPALPSTDRRSSSEAQHSDPFEGWVIKQPWPTRAECQNYPQHYFFGKEYEGKQRHRPSLTSVEIRRAKAICAVCPVMWDCYVHALENEEEYGIWGGTTRQERQDLRERLRETL
jgi:WhiB family transcriptional regulator, redox-sensing transcriptional regulator